MNENFHKLLGEAIQAEHLDLLPPEVDICSKYYDDIFRSLRRGSTARGAKNMKGPDSTILDLHN